MQSDADDTLEPFRDRIFAKVVLAPQILICGQLIRVPGVDGYGGWRNNGTKGMVQHHRWLCYLNIEATVTNISITELAIEQMSSINYRHDKLDSLL